MHIHLKDAAKAVHPASRGDLENLKEIFGFSTDDYVPGPAAIDFYTRAMSTEQNLVVEHGFVSICSDSKWVDVSYYAKQKYTRKFYRLNFITHITGNHYSVKANALKGTSIVEKLEYNPYVYHFGCNMMINADNRIHGPETPIVFGGNYYTPINRTYDTRRHWKKAKGTYRGKTISGKVISYNFTGELYALKIVCGAIEYPFEALENIERVRNPIRIGLEFTLVDENDDDDKPAQFDTAIREIIDSRLQAGLHLVTAALKEDYLHKEKIMQGWRIYRDLGCAEFSSPYISNINQLADWWEIIVNTGKRIGLTTENSTMNQGMHVNIDVLDIEDGKLLINVTNKFPSISWAFAFHEEGCGYCVRGIPELYNEGKSYDIYTRGGYVEMRAPKMPRTKTDVKLVCKFYKRLVERIKIVAYTVTDKKENKREDIANYTLLRAVREFKYMCGLLSLRYNDYRHLVRENLYARFYQNRAYSQHPTLGEAWEKERRKYIDEYEDCRYFLLV